MGLFNRKPKVVELQDKRPLLPEGIEEVERGYRVVGRISIHKTVGKALNQLRGMQNVN